MTKIIKFLQIEFDEIAKAETLENADEINN